MANKQREHVTLACTECKNRNYISFRNKKNHPDKLELRKYCKHCNKMTLHKEVK